MPNAQFHPSLPGFYPRGLSVVRQYRPDKGVYHVGILDVGNRLNLRVPLGAEPVVVHLPPEGLHADYVSGTGAWEFVRAVGDEPGARMRLAEAVKRPKYELVGNNCEHFVHFVETGVRKSPSLAAAGLFAATIVGIVLLARS